jgi:hypothetical protein
MYDLWAFVAEESHSDCILRKCDQETPKKQMTALLSLLRVDTAEVDT